MNVLCPAMTRILLTAVPWQNARTWPARFSATAPWDMKEMGRVVKARIYTTTIGLRQALPHVRELPKFCPEHVRCGTEWGFLLKGTTFHLGLSFDAECLAVATLRRLKRRQKR